MAFWLEAEKNDFISCLRRKDFESFDSLSCFYRSSYDDLSPNNAKKLIKKLYVDLDENDLDVQEKFYNLLDKIIDGLCLNKYKTFKKKLMFYSINQINDKVISEFRGIDEYNFYSVLKDLATTFVNCVDDKSLFVKYYQTFEDLYIKYMEGDLSKEDTKEFYNDILNRQQDMYIKMFKGLILDSLIYKLPYAERKEKSREYSYKLSKFDEILKSKNYEVLDTNINIIKDRLESFSMYLLDLKTLKKAGVNLKLSQINEMNELFLNGSLDLEDVRRITNLSVELANIIYDKYVQFKIPYLENIPIDEERLPDLKLGYNYNNYKIACNKFYLENLASLFINIKEKDVEKILSSLDINPNLSLLVFFIDYFKDFKAEHVLAILKNYYRVVKKLKLDPNKDFGISFDKLLSLCEAYNNADDFTLLILGEDKVKKIVQIGGFTSRDPVRYIDVYKKMLKRDKVAIPPISGEYEDLYYETAKDSDMERLLIGKNCFCSCIGIDGGGDAAYYKSLTEQDGDVILFKSKATNEFVARSLCFRKGNYLVFAPIHGEQGLEERLYDFSLWNEIGSKILSLSKEKDDNLSYIFLKCLEGMLSEDFPIVQSDDLHIYFPHADLKDGDCYLVGKNNDSDEINLKPNLSTNTFYNTKREEIKTKDEINNEDFNRIRILKLLMNDDSYIREELLKNFTYDNIDNYDYVFLGQDFCIALKDGEISSNIILPTNCEMQLEELNKLYNYLISNGLIKSYSSENLQQILSGIRH
ncbi:MAG: hypothetical protein HFJ11_01410 [Bacilli bacterium]|nr:hypothetical protein [Bacilli bacterium]